MRLKKRRRSFIVERNLDFDTVVDRKNTNCLKYDFAVERGMPEDVLPLWVADMDFKTSSYVQDALNRQIEHGIFGYSESKDEYFEAVSGWMKRHHNWEVSKDWLVKTPGVVFALAMAVQAFTDPGDKVLIQLPVYYPFSGVIRGNGRVIVSNTLVYGDDNRYHIDFDDFEKKIVDENIKLFFLCSPHNPVGRVWTKEELIQLGDICYKHHVIVVSDEIHADFAFKGKHQVFANLKKEYEEITITCTAPSKTFNLAGLQVSNVFIANPKLRKAFCKQIDIAGYSQLNVIGLVACEAAYRHGDEWYEAMLRYVKSNIDFTRKYVEENLPGVTMAEHEGTYLVWLDFRDTGLDVEQLEHMIVHEAKLWLDSGKIFGDSGKGFQRINVACPRVVLEEALSRIKSCLK
ncbi:MAG: pyridoxal phosphate-dependent aminotransferase [Lachnospiraceae bacterium]|nr:pyridoxal phosphate-dependent aminotransferase [Lachnospiraceae bacterium]